MQSMRVFMQGFLLGGLVGVMAVWLMRARQPAKKSSTMRRVGERVQKLAARVQKK